MCPLEEETMFWLIIGVHDEDLNEPREMRPMALDRSRSHEVMENN